MIESLIYKKILNFIHNNKLINKDDSLLLAVSGGSDSIALLKILNSLKGELAIKVAVFHLDHQIRKNSYKDSQFVASVAKNTGVRFIGRKYDVASFAKKNKLSLQEAGRLVRYRLLQKEASKVGANKIATGHQANDQIETFFLRLLRGAALTGLQGIPIKRGNIIRPLLNMPREELIRYLNAIKTPFLSDPSNIKPIYLRNRVRNELLPIIQTLNPSYLTVLLKNINLLNEEEQLLDLLSSELSSHLLKKENDFIVIDKKGFSSLAAALKKRLTRDAINLTKGNLRQIESKHIELIIENYADFGFTLELPNNLLFYSDYKLLRFGFKKAFKPQKIELTSISAGQEKEVKPLGNLLGAKIVKQCDSSPLVACLDYAKIKPPLKVRSRKRGDRFQPLGLKGTKKLQDYFVDVKVPKFLRDSVVIVEDQEKIIWIAGYQIDNRAKTDRKTKIILRLELK